MFEPGKVKMDRQLFLSQVLPADGYINIREIADGKAENKFFTSDNLHAYEPPDNSNIYYGVFTRRDKYGTAEYCNKTAAIWADYDNAQLADVKERISNAGIPQASIYINSGHGIHAYWLLEQPATVKQALPIVKGIVKRTGADTRATDAARVMRLPGTINHNRSKPVPCHIVEHNTIKYTIDQLAAFKADYKPSIEKPGQIPELDNSSRPCIKNLAKGVPAGKRNFAQGRLIKYLQQQGHTKKQTKEIITRWNTRNRPPEKTQKLDKDFYAYWHGDYKLLGCHIKDGNLQSLLSDYCDKINCYLTGRIDRLDLSQATRYNNRLMNHLTDITGYDLIIYGLLCIDTQGLNTSELMRKMTARATGKCCMSDRTFTASTRRLSRLGLIEIIKRSRRTGHEYFYKAIPQGTYGLGYTIVTAGAVNGAIDGRVTPGQFKVYALLLKYAYAKGSCYPSSDTLAKELRVSKTYITRAINELVDANYIRKRYIYPKGVKKLVLQMLV